MAIAIVVCDGEWYMCCCCCVLSCSLSCTHSPCTPCASTEIKNSEIESKQHNHTAAAKHTFFFASVTLSMMLIIRSPQWNVHLQHFKLQSSRYISFQRGEWLRCLFTDYNTSWGSADRPNIMRSDYMMIGPLMMMLKTITVQLLGQYWHIIYQNDCLSIGYQIINFIIIIGSIIHVGRSN